MKIDIKIRVGGEVEETVTVKDMSIVDWLLFDSSSKTASEQFLKKTCNTPLEDIEQFFKFVPGFKEKFEVAIDNVSPNKYVERLNKRRERAKKLFSQLVFDPMLFCMSLTEAKYGTEYTNAQLLQSLPELISMYSTMTDMLTSFAKEKTDTIQSLIGKTMLQSLIGSSSSNHDSKTKEANGIRDMLLMIKKGKKGKKDEKVDKKG